MDTLHQLFTGAFLLVGRCGAKGNTTRRSRAAVELAAFSNEGHEMGTWTLAIASLMVTLAIATLITLAIGFGTLLVTLSVYHQ